MALTDISFITAENALIFLAGVFIVFRYWLKTSSSPTRCPKGAKEIIGYAIKYHYFLK